MYSKELGNHPDGEKMRFIPVPTYIQNSSIHDKYSDIIQRQSWFLACSGTMTSFEIHGIDNKVTGLDKTLRQNIMEMKTKSNKPLFLTVDEGYSGGIVFTFPKKYEDEARNRIADLGSYLHFHHSDLILLKYFTPDAAARALDSPWNDNLQMAVTTLESELNNVIKECDDCDWIDAPSQSKQVVITPPPINEPVIRPDLFNHPPDDDTSLESFGIHSTRPDISRNTINSGSPIPIHTPQSQVNLDIELEDLTVEGDISMASLTSRISTLEDGFRQMNQLNQNLTQFMKIIGTAGTTPSLANFQQGFNNTPDPREGEGAGLH